MESQLKSLRVSTFSQFSKKKLSEVKRFVSRCKQRDGYEPVFYWGVIENRKNSGINELLCYTETKDIVSYVALYHFEENEIEITLMTDPKFRHMSVYEALLAQVKRIVSGYPAEIARYVFTCNQKCIVLKGYLSALGARRFQFTHKLAVTAKKFALFEKKNSVIRDVAVDPIEFRRATASDMLALVRLEVDCFQISPDIYKREVSQTLQDPNKEIIVAVKNQEIVGKIHVQIEKKKAQLYDLCVATHEQGQGYGASLLLGVLKLLFDREIKKVLVDVESDVHLNWYKSFNFQHMATYEHWRLLAKSPVKEREKQLETLLLNFQCYQVQDQLSHSVYKH